MYKNEYLNKILVNVKEKCAEQKEFINAVEEFLDSMDYIVGSDPDIEKYAILERIVVPERVVMFRVPWVDDNGKIQVNNGYRVQFNSAIGPYKGGLRLDPSVNLSILKFLGFEQIFKNSLTGLPMGGGKGGSDFNPKGKSDAEVMRFCQSFMQELYQVIGPNTDVPAGDIGVGAREIGYMYGMYKKLTKDVTGVLTGKGISFGGSLTRTEATGFGLCYFAEELLKTYYNDSFNGKNVVISGSGNVAQYAAFKATELGAKVVAMSDRNGYIASEDGIDIEFVRNIKNERKSLVDEYVKKYPNTKNGKNTHDIWKIKCDIALPSATQNEINIEDAKALVKNGCKVLCEGANMPTELDAVKYLYENGVIFSPGKASNAGGVAVSGLEMSQNAMHLSWTFEEVDQKLKEIMQNIFKACYETASKYGEPKNLSLGANIAGFLKVYNAMKAQGVI
ncbi:NADP-specific glutamate dehydrogenase [bacterium]|nr:NADP-specific glutamate dehydrogenase [bacterium]